MGDIQMYNFKVTSIIHDYEVHFIDSLKQSIDSVLMEGDYIIIDNIVKDLYDEYLQDALDTHKFIGIDANEKTKSYQGVESVIEELIQNGFRKNHRLVAIGGGITQDVTAFISSIMYRGVNWIFYPTTMLAQGDSCIGSKTSINFGRFKNQVGGFYPPSYIYIFPPFKDTLKEKEIRSGMGEMLHYFIVSGKEDFDFYRDTFKAAFTEKDALSGIINKSLEIKKRYIEIDEFDKKERQVFNYGHTFGHAIESLTQYRIPHGIAVSYGMDMSNFVSVKMGLIPSEVRDEIREVTSYIWEGYPIDDIDIDTYINALSKDKKNVGMQLGLILNKGYGNIFKNLTDSDKTFREWIEEYFLNELK
ncbi:AroB-related putative sugar phosphate phospholyase (cyclizing) [Chlorobium limicola]|nr:AroB-related putative sugar phosphate phospholyase (cyclizing) [Chlorobium limicola]